MTNRLFVLNSLFLIISSILHGAEISASQKGLATPSKKFFNQNPDKQSLIKRIFIWNKLLDINNSNDDLFVIKHLIQKGLLTNLETLNTYFKKESLEKKSQGQIEYDEKFLNNLIQALYCLTWSEKDIADVKAIGKKIVLTAHSDKGYFSTNSTVSTTISEFLINNICENSLHNLFENKKQEINRAQDTIITNNYYRIITGKYFGSAAGQIGYNIGTKLISKVIPECDKKTYYILCNEFTTKSEVNNLLLNSELNKYPQQQLRSRTRQ